MLLIIMYFVLFQCKYSLIYVFVVIAG